MTIKEQAYSHIPPLRNHYDFIRNSGLISQENNSENNKIIEIQQKKTGEPDTKIAVS